MAYGTLNSDIVQSSTTGTPPQFNDGSGAQIGTLCRAWVKFAATATPSVSASFNVSSVTFSSTGIWNIAFTNSLSDSNYAVSIGQGQNATNNNTSNTAYNQTVSGFTTAHFESNANSNMSLMYLSVFR